MLVPLLAVLAGPPEVLRFGHARIAAEAAPLLAPLVAALGPTTCPGRRSSGRRYENTDG